MAAFTTVITEHNDSENRRVYAITGHTASMPKLLIQKRKEPTATNKVASDTLMVVYGDEDASAVPIENKCVLEAVIRRSIEGSSTISAAALAVFRDFVASDQFAAIVSGQTYVQ